MLQLEQTLEVAAWEIAEMGIGNFKKNSLHRLRNSNNLTCKPIISYHILIPSFNTFSLEFFTKFFKSNRRTKIAIHVCVKIHPSRLQF